MKKLLALVFLLLSSPAFAQSVQQSGTVTPGHLPYWLTNGVIADGGTAANGLLTSLGITASGPSFCQNSASNISGAYQQLCLGVTTASGATISLQNYGSAPSGALNFVVNGISYPFPGSLSTITLNSTPVIGGNNGNCFVGLKIAYT